MNDINTHYDCIVMGGGPAGSTAATLVAEAGFSTLLVERATMPRLHVGESLMPETYWIFERLGVLDQMKASCYPQKVGVQFVFFVVPHFISSYGIQKHKSLPSRLGPHVAMPA